MASEEHSIQKEIQVALSRKGYKVFRANVGSVRTSDGRFFKTGLPSGFFDLFGFRPEDGKIFFIEVKNETGKARPDQIRFHEMLQDNYIIHGFCRSAFEAVAVVEEKLIGYGFNG